MIWCFVKRFSDVLIPSWVNGSNLPEEMWGRKFRCSHHGRKNTWIILFVEPWLIDTDFPTGFVAIGMVMLPQAEYYNPIEFLFEGSGGHCLV